jgi:hypothetical protein
MEQGKGKQGESEKFTVIIPDEFYVNIKAIGRSLGAIAMRLYRSQLKTNTARIKYLQGLGFDRNDIAGILGTTPATVSVRLSEGRSAKKNRRKRRGKN